MSLITPDALKKAKQTDLGAWLLQRHPEAVKLSYGAVLLRADEHVSTKAGFCGFSDYRTGETGNAIDYLTKYLGYSFRDAVFALLGTESHDAPPPSTTDKRTVTPVQGMKADFVVPQKADTTKNVIAYLTGRHIPAETVVTLLRQGILYQDTYNNAVFITPEHDYYELRGTNTYADARCRHCKTCPLYASTDHKWCANMATCAEYKSNPFHGGGSQKPARFWYFTPSDRTEQVFICEAAIDAISLSVIHQNNNLYANATYVSIGGAAKQKTIDRIKRHCSNMIIATDNDDAGDACRSRNPELHTIKPVTKDWNNDLQGGHYYVS